ncbi:hypothetical protein BG015_004224, partial [Linnemannia schmuckeri]
MALEDPSSDEHIQVVRRVYENSSLTNAPSPVDIFHITYHVDPATGKGIILWDDLQAVFRLDPLGS